MTARLELKAVEATTRVADAQFRGGGAVQTTAEGRAVRNGESELVGKAFAALGEGPTARELDLVAAALEDEHDVFWEAAHDQAAFEALVEVAAENGSSGFVALDLVTVITTGESRVGA